MSAERVIVRSAVKVKALTAEQVTRVRATPDLTRPAPVSTRQE